MKEGSSSLVLKVDFGVCSESVKVEVSDAKCLRSLAELSVEALVKLEAGGCSLSALVAVDCSSSAEGPDSLCISSSAVVSKSRSSSGAGREARRKTLSQNYKTRVRIHLQTEVKVLSLPLQLLLSAVWPRCIASTKVESGLAEFGEFRPCWNPTPCTFRSGPCQSGPFARSEVKIDPRQGWEARRAPRLWAYERLVEVGSVA